MTDMTDMIFEKYKNEIAEIVRIHNKSNNIFKILKLEDYEIRHSAFLSWLFDINGSHGLETAFAEKFFEASLGENSGINSSNITSVRTEVRTDSGERIDILIEGSDFTCTIENKYGSDVHGNQCQNYRKFIEEKNPNKKNYFVFLDIQEPDDYKEKQGENQDYYKYAFIDYKKIKEILETIKEQSKDGEITFVRTLIEQYIQVLDEKYNPEPDSETLKQYKKIKPDDIQKIIKYYGKMNNSRFMNEFTESEKLFISTVKRCYDYNKTNNDKWIKEILKELIKKVSFIKDNYGTGRNTNGKISYAYALTIPDSILPGKKSFLKSVDYTALGELSIDIYAGLSASLSTIFVDYINGQDSFWDRLKTLLGSGWECELSYRVGLPNNYLNKDNSLVTKIVCDVNQNESFSNLIKTDYIVSHANNDTMESVEAKTTSVKKCIKGLVNCGQLSKEKAESIYDKISQKCDKGIAAAWCLKLSYPTGIDRCNEDNKNELKALYKSKTIEGLNLFEFEKDSNKCRPGDMYSTYFN